MKKIGLSFCIAISLFSCQKQNYISIQDAQEQRNLERANNASVTEFFQFRMENELTKASKEDWHVITEDDTFVYFGQYKAGENEKKYTLYSPFLKVDKAALKERFPSYKNISGKHIKSKLFHYFIQPLINENLATQCPSSYGIEYDKKQYKLTKKGIEAHIKFTGKCYEKKVLKGTIKTILSPEHLDVLEQEVTIK